MSNPLETLRDRSRYTIPETPAVAWSDQSGRRRLWAGRAGLAGVLLLQSVLSLQLWNSPSQDEALDLFVGRLLLDGSHDFGKYTAHLGGSPYLYPPVAAMIDSVAGLFGARALSLLFMLASTGLLYSFTRRLFNERTAILSAATYGVLQPTIVLGFLATYDATAVFLLALALWLVVRLVDRPSPLTVAAVAPVCVLMYAVKYATVLFLPSVVIVVAVLAVPRFGQVRAALRGLGLAVGIGPGVLLSGGVRDGIASRTAAGQGPLQVLTVSGRYGGLFFLIALGGGIAYARRAGMGENPEKNAIGPGRRSRSLFVVVLLATALLVPLRHADPHTSTIGLGLLFVAPLAGVGTSRLMGAHVRNPQYGVAVWTCLFVLGLSQARVVYSAWPNSTGLVSVLVPLMSPKGRYLASAPQVVFYQLGRDRTSPDQWTSANGFTRLNAITAGEFDLVVLDDQVEPRTNAQIIERLRSNPRYRLRARLPYTGKESLGGYEIWVKYE